MGMRDWVAKVVTGGVGVAEKGSLSRFPFLAKTQDASRKRWGERRRLTVEALEPRLMLSVTALAVGEFTVLDNGTGTPAGVFFVDNTTTAGVVADVTTIAGSASVAEKVTGIQIDLGTHSGVGTFKVELGMSGTTGAAPNVTFLNMNAGDKITMDLNLDTVTDGVAGAGYQATSSFGFASNTSGAGAYHVNADYTADGGTLAAATDIAGADPTYVVAGAIGTTTVPVSIGGGGGVGHLAASGLTTRNFNGTNIGLMTLNGIDLTGGSSLAVGQFSSLAGGTVAGITVVGDTTLQNNDLLIQLDSKASLEPLSLSATGTITLNGSGSLTVESYPGNILDVGALTFGNFQLTGSGSAIIEGDPANSTAIGQVTIGTVGISGASGTNNLTIGNGANLDSFSSGITIGAITDSSTGGAGVIINATSITGATTTGAITNSNTGYFYLNATGATGVITTGVITDSDSGYVQFNVGGAVSALVFGDITTYGSDFNITALAFGDVTLGNVAILGAGNVNITSTPLGNIVVGSLAFNSSGNLNILETTGSIGNITIGDIEFDSGVSAGSGLKVNAATGVGDVLINSVDYYNPAFGVIQINANTSGTTGAIGTITISNPGDNSFAYGTAADTTTGPGNAWNNVEWGTGSFAVGLSIGNINIAGGAEGAFIGSLVPNGLGDTVRGIGNDGAPALHTGGTGTIGTVTLAGESDGLVLVADDGIGALNINTPPAAAQTIAAATDGNTLFSIATGITIDANNDIVYEDGNGTPGANIVGSMGSIHVSGDSTTPVALSGTVTGVAVGDITLDFGNMQLSVQAGTSFTNAPSALDRLALNDTGTSKIGNILVSSGSIGNPSASNISNFFADNFIADSGVGTIKASGSMIIGVVSGNHIAFDAIAGTIAHPSVNHPIGAITAGGSILIWNYRNIETTGAAATTADLATEDVGDINAGGSIEIDHFAIGGDINNIVVTRTAPSTYGFVLLPDFTVNGNVGIISSGGAGGGFTGADWTDGTLMLTDLNAFTKYNWTAGDQITLTSGTGVGLGTYTVASKLSNSSITLTSSITGGPGVTDNSIVGVLQPLADNVTIGGLWTPGPTPVYGGGPNALVRGDPTWINAGDGLASLSLHIMHAVRVAGPGAPPVVLVTQGNSLPQSATDYVVSVGGTWNAGLTPAVSPSMDLTLTFDGTGTGSLTNGTLGVGNNVRINDIFGVTSAADTVLMVATRSNPTDANNLAAYAATGLGGKTNTARFNLAGFQDTFGGAGSDKGRNSFSQIVVEGDLFGAIGDPGNALPTATANFVLSSTNAAILGDVKNIEIMGTWWNPPLDTPTTTPSAARIFVRSLGEISVGTVNNLKLGSFSYEAVNAASTPTNPSYRGVDANSARDGVWEDLEVFGPLGFASGEVNVVVAPGTTISKSFVGPTGQLEFIGLNNNDDDVVGTFDITFSSGMITSIYLFGEKLKIEYNALDPANPATNSSTNIFYGVSHNGNIATEPTSPDDQFGVGTVDNAIDFLEFSSTIGNVTSVDINPANQIAASVGNILVGYAVVINDASDEQSLNSYINNPNITGTGSTLRFTAAGVPVYGAIGNITVDGALGGVVSSGGVLAITTNDTMNETLVGGPATPSADFLGLVTDGSAGLITINGSVGYSLDAFGMPFAVTSGGSLVVGDPVATHLNAGPDGIFGTGDEFVDAIGLVGTPSFTGPIIVTGNLGSWAQWVPTTTVTFTSAQSVGAENIQAPMFSSYNSTYIDVAETTPNLTNQLANLASTYSGEQVSAPDSLGTDASHLDIIVGGNIYTAFVSGKRIVVDQKENQSAVSLTDPADSIVGNVFAGLTGSTHTGGDIHGDFWSGDMIGATGGGTVIEAFSQDSLVNGTEGTATELQWAKGGSISGVDTSVALLVQDGYGDAIGGHNESVLVYASGASAGNITSDILADADIVDIHVIAGSGHGGSLLANIIAGLDPLYNTVDNVAGPSSANNGQGGGILENLSFNEILADNEIGHGTFVFGTTTPDLLAYGNVVSSAGNMTWTDVKSGQQNDEVAVGGDINTDFVAGVPIGATLPVSVHFNDATMPIMQNQNDSIVIDHLWAMGNVDEALAEQPPEDVVTLSNLNGTLVAAGGIDIGRMDIQGNAIGNDGVAGRHIAAAGMGFKDATFSSCNLLIIGAGSEIDFDLLGTFSSGTFVPADSGVTVGGMTVAANSPLNPNDVGPMVAGTVLTLGEVDIVDLTVGRWLQGATGVSGSDVIVPSMNSTTTPGTSPGITLDELLAGTESGTNQAYSPDFSIGATCDITVNIDAIGRPIVAPQTGGSNQAGQTGGVSTDGDINKVSIGAFGAVSGTVTATNTADFTFVMSNMDAITALGSTDSSPMTPSPLGFFLPLNSGGGSGSGAGIDNSLSIYAYGAGTGGLNIVFDLAGFDYFTRINVGTETPTTPNFWASFGLGSIGSVVTTTQFFTGATWNLETATLTETDAFALYSFSAGDTVTFTSGPLIGTYTVTGKTDSSNITLSGLAATDTITGSNGFLSTTSSGTVGVTLSAGDLSPAMSAAAGNLTFALIAAGQDIADSSFLATHDIIAYTDSATTDGAPGLIPDGFGGWLPGDVLAGLSANSSISQSAESDLFPGGNIINTQMIAGCDIYEGTFTVTTSGGGNQAFSGVLGGQGVLGYSDSFFVPPTDTVTPLGADWTDSTKTLTASVTASGLFASYNFTPGDMIYLASGTGVTPGFYTITSKIDNNSITLGQDINGAAGDITDASIVGAVASTGSMATQQFNNAEVLAVHPGAQNITLTGVTVFRGISTNGGSFQITNNAGQPASGNATENRNISLSSPGISPDLAINDPHFTNVPVPAGATVNVPQPPPLGPLSSSDPVAGMAVPAGSFAPFTGSGNVAYNVDTASTWLWQSQSGGGGNWSQIAVLPSYAANVWVEYTYTYTTPVTTTTSSVLHMNPAMPFLTVAAKGGSGNTVVGHNNGNVDITMVSGVVDQTTGPDLFNNGKDNDLNVPDAVDDETGNIWAYIVAGGDVTGLIDAGDTHQLFGGVFGLGGSGFPTGQDDQGRPYGDFFRGGIHAGAGPDLNIMTTSDNDPNGSIHANIWTAGTLNVENWDTPTAANLATITMPRLVDWNLQLGDGFGPLGGPAVVGTQDILLGILANGNIDDGHTDGDPNVGHSIEGGIEVGWGPVGGDLLGNVIAEGNIEEIEVWGNLGRAGFDSLVAAGGSLNLYIGNAPGIPSADADSLIRDSSLYTGTFGTVFADVVAGGFNADGQSVIEIGGGVDQNATIVVGAFSGGVTDFTTDLPGGGAFYHFNHGKGMFTITGGAPADFSNPGAPGVGNVDIIAVKNDSTGGIDLVATPGTRPASIHQLIAGDRLDHLHVVDGSVGQIIVDDDYAIGTKLANEFSGISIPLSAFPFFTDSLPDNGVPGGGTISNFNDDKLPIDAGIINVDYNIGVDAAAAGLAGETLAQSIGKGLTGITTADNVAVWVQGALTGTDGYGGGGSITSETGSVGNVVLGWFDGSSLIAAHQDIGDVYLNEGGVGLFNEFYAELGGVGVVSAEGDIFATTESVVVTTTVFDESTTQETVPGNFDIYTNLGGLISREGQVTTAAAETIVYAGGTETTVVTTPGEVLVHGSIGLLRASGDITGTFIAETGDIGLDLDTTDMFQAIGFQSGPPVVSGTGIYSDAGDITLELNAGRDIGNTEAHLFSVHPYYIAGRNIGDVTAGADIGGSGMMISAVDCVTWGVTQGDGLLVAERGRVGNILSLAGDIGSSTTDGYGGGTINRLVIRANGGVVIDPNTLDYFPITDTNGNGVLDERNGIGNIFADIGSIWVDATTGTDLGANAASGVVVGGIAAPVGSVDAILHVGGDVGGVSGQSVNLNGSESTVNGVIGIIHHQNGNNGTDTTRVIGPNGTLTVSSGGVNYVITIGGGNGNVSYTDLAGFVTFGQITYNSDGSPTSGITLVTQTLTGTASPVLAQVNLLTVNGNVNTVAVEGNVDSLVVNGNLGLANGNLNIQGNLGSLTVTGNVGTSGGTSTNHNLTVFVGGHFGSADVQGTNFFAQEETIDSKSKFASATVTAAGKSLSFAHGGEFTNIFLASGSANVFFDGTLTGQVTEIDLLGTSASGLLIVESDHVMTLVELKAQAGMVAKGLTQTKVGSVIVKNEVFDHGSTINEPATAVVGSILGSGAKFKLNGLILEGDVNTVFTAGALQAAYITGDASSVDGGQTIKGLTVGDDLGIAKAVVSITGVTVSGDLKKTITAGGKVDSVIVLGDAGTINAGTSVTNVNVLGNAGVISAGKTLKNIAVAGDMLALNAMTMTNVAVRGGVGLAISGGSNGASSNSTGSSGSGSTDFTLGGSFCAQEAASIFGLGDDLSDPLSALRGIGIKGAHDTVFLGGVEAVKVSGVSVGGAISDLMLTGQNVLNGGADGLLTATMNNAFVAGRTSAKVGLASNWVKEDGVLIEWPGQSVNTTNLNINIDDLVRALRAAFGG